MRIYLDVDDTLAQFREHAVANGVPRWTGSWYTTSRDGWTDEQKHIQERTNELMRSQEFWETMPVWDRAHELIAASSFKGRTYLLTATPSSLAGEPDVIDMVRRVKTQWAWQKLHVPPDNVIVCARHEKLRYAYDPFAQHANMLIDDATQTCSEWIAAGGEAHHFHADSDWGMYDAINFVKSL